MELNTMILIVSFRHYNNLKITNCFIDNVKQIFFNLPIDIFFKKSKRYLQVEVLNHRKHD